LSNSLAVVIKIAIQIANAAPDQWHILWLDDLDKYLRASLLEHSDVEHSYRSPRWPRWQQFERSHCKRCKKVMTITPGAPNICW
jgi:hypothetical protein